MLRGEGECESARVLYVIVAGCDEVACVRVCVRVCVCVWGMGHGWLVVVGGVLTGSAAAGLR